MASGFSKRFGARNKLLVPFRGKPLARYALDLAAGLQFEGGVFFITASADVAALADDLPMIKVIRNNAPEKDLRESVRLGVESTGPECGYYLFLHCDQPFLDTVTVRRILDARKPGCIVEPRYKDRPGNPCLFSAFFRQELLSLKEGETPKLIKARYPEALKFVHVQDVRILQDIDDEETFAKLQFIA